MYVVCFQVSNSASWSSFISVCSSASRPGKSLRGKYTYFTLNYFTLHCHFLLYIKNYSGEKFNIENVLYPLHYVVESCLFCNSENDFVRNPVSFLIRTVKLYIYIFFYCYNIYMRARVGVK